MTKVLMCAYNKRIQTELDMRLQAPRRTDVTWAPQQTAIFNWFTDEQNCRGSNNLIIRARAGCAKTTTAIEAANRIPDAIKDAKTLHALGLMFLRAGWNEVEIDGDVEKERIDKAITGARPQWDVLMATRKLMSYAKGVDPFVDEDTLADIAIARNLDGDDDRFGAYWMASVVRRAMDASLQKRPDRRVSFDDMIFIPAALGFVQRLYDWVIVDEAQDMNKAQLILAQGACKEDGHIVIIGDDRQCHPAGTLIETTGGKRVPVEVLIEGAELVTYHDCFRGLRTQGRTLEKIASREYYGDILTIAAGGEAVDVTPSHRIPTRLTDDKPRWGLYLMERGTVSRIGCCQLMYQSGFGPSLRARHEDADRLWVLKTFDDREDAQIEETLTALRFGLPEQIFQEKGYIKERLLTAIGDNRSRAIHCLEAFGRNWDFPLYEKDDGKHLGRYLYVTQACNLLDDANEVRTFDGTQNGGSWATVKVTRNPTQTRVYSLQVAPTEGGLRLYVADRILVHNSIYGFRGADIDCLDRLKDELHAEELGLNTTYRCPQAVVEIAQRLVPDFVAAASAPLGQVVEGDVETVLNKARAGDVILSRTNAPLVPLCLSFIRKQVPAKIEGRDIGKMLAERAKKLKAFTIEEFYEKLGAWEMRATKRAYASEKNVDAKLQQIMDIYETLSAIAEDCETMEIFYERCNKMFADVAESGSGGCVVLSTIHKAKGLEWDRVFILRSTLYCNGKKFDDREEANIEYVAVTRAKSALMMVGGNTDV